ncbi:MAG: primosomal protein N' [Pseudomonadales bacterium]|nr:primosomal protein N' [Pseudomonadales bacterium]
MTPPRPILEIALPVPLRRVFDYLPPDDLDTHKAGILAAGTRIKVPFGNRQMVGILLRSKTQSLLPADKLRSALSILDKQPVLDSQQLKLLQWAASYYHHPYGEALHTALPALLCKTRSPKPKTTNHWQLSLHGKGLPEQALKRSPRQSAALDFIRSHPGLSTRQISDAGISEHAIRALYQKKLIEPLPTFSEDLTTDIDNRLTGAETAVTAEPGLKANKEQQLAIDAITGARGFECFLLDGITGSGKTEVYLQVIESVLKQGRQALVLVPEIGLTPQTLARFSARFNRRACSYHSGLTDRQRLQVWQAAATQEADIIIGTRSAVFLPLKNPGILIVDEEHDTSFKQQDNFRYSARDLAVVRGQLENIPIVLGSATPSLETLQNALDGRYKHIRLLQRAGRASPPAFELIDTRTAPLEQGFSAKLLTNIRNQLEAGQQVLVFLNRRGYAPALICGNCHWVATCPHCDTRLTVHRKQNLLRCHHCDFRQTLMTACPSCHNPKPDFVGMGIQRSEDFLQQHFPDFPTLRIDRDSIRKESDWEQLNSTIASGQPMILLGTQMLAKGHHYADVTLVAIVDADQGFFSADFRSAERMAQLITQVSGRAGRTGKPGKVLIQTRYHTHPLLKTLTTESYHQLARSLLQERRLLDLPPFTYQAIFRAEAKKAGQAEQWLANVKKQLQQTSPAIKLIGPLPCIAEKRAGFYRYELTLWCRSRKALHAGLDKCFLYLEEEKTVNRCRWHIDIDPYFS